MSTRCYVPGDWAWVWGATGEGELEGHAVTASLRAALPDLDDEQLEHYASTEAAQRSLLLHTDAGPPRRLVLVLDLDDDRGTPEPVGESPTAVRVRGVRAPGDLVGWLVDTAEAADDVRRAAAALRSGDPGDPGTTAAVEACLDHELAWYAATETDLVRELR